MGNDQGSIALKLSYNIAPPGWTGIRISILNISASDASIEL